MQLEFRGVLFQALGKFASRVERHFSVPWREDAILDVFAYEEEHIKKDDQRLWSAAQYLEGAHRGNAGLNVNHAAVLDRDCADVGELDGTIEHLRSLGLAALVYTSWSHGLPDKVHADTGIKGPFDCYRVVLPYSRDVTPAEHSVIVQGLFGFEVPLDPSEYMSEVVGRLVTLPSGKERAARPRGWDPSSAQPARGYYAPAPQSVLEVWPGRPLDVDAILRRPTTAHPTQRAFRPLQAPTAESLGALTAFDRALRQHDCGLGNEGFSGWRRSSCPSCKDPSPSLTARANGDGLDLRCHAGCKRFEILAAVGLDQDGLFAPPSELRLSLDEQLARQVPPDAPVAVDAAVDRLVDDIREALHERVPTVIRYPAGTGKSHAAATVIAEKVREGERIIYATQEHVVAHETRMKLPPDIRARSVHTHSPLIPVGNESACARRDELEERVFRWGVSLLGSICPRCPLKESCEARADAAHRAELLPTANVVFVSHAGIQQVCGEDRGHDARLIVDEMPSTYLSLRVEHDELKALADAALPSLDSTMARVVRELAGAWLKGTAPGDIYLPYEDRHVGVVEYACERRRVAPKDLSRPTPAEQELLRAADTLVRMAVWREEGGKVCNVDRPTEGVWAMLPDACHEALVQHDGVLLSATPLMPALPGFKIRECEVSDGARVRRVMLLKGHRGSRALTQAFYDDSIGRRVVRDRTHGDLLGIPWPEVDAALVRAAREAMKYDVRRVLFVTFKAIADELRRNEVWERVRHAFGNTAPVDFEIGHYGALRGKNDWQEGAAKECSVVYCFGTPRFALKPTLVQLGLFGEAADQAWVDYAAGELAQAEGRLRLPRRKKPCTVMVEGDVAPSTWHPELVDEVIDDPPDEATASALLEASCLLQSAGEAEKSVVAGWPVPRVTAGLRAEAQPSIAHGIGLLARASEGRKRAFEKELLGP